MHSKGLRIIVALFFLASIAQCIAEVSEPNPTPVSKSDWEARRAAIHVELDGNHDAVQELYVILDVTPEADHEARDYIEAQIHQFDARNDVLYDELDSIDQHEFKQQRRIELEQQASRMLDEAKQLRRTNYIPAAIGREAKAASIKKALADGTWKLQIDGEWSCDHAKPTVAESVQLAVEVEHLKRETAALRSEVQELKKLLAKLEISVGRIASGK